ncbi:MAG: hypothetical protein U0903_18315 [Planctomycetales bacterium]
MTGEGLNKLRAEAPIETNLLPALLEFVAARRYAPWHAVYYREIGWLSFLGAPFTKERDAQLIETADSLDPYNTENILVCGQAGFSSGALGCRGSSLAASDRFADIPVRGRGGHHAEGQWDHQGHSILLPDSIDQIVTIYEVITRARSSSRNGRSSRFDCSKRWKVIPSCKTMNT